MDSLILEVKEHPLPQLTHHATCRHGKSPSEKRRLISTERRRIKERVKSSEKKGVGSEGEFSLHVRNAILFFFCCCLLDRETHYLTHKPSNLPTKHQLFFYWFVSLHVFLFHLSERLLWLRPHMSHWCAHPCLCLTSFLRMSLVIERSIFQSSLFHY